VHKTCAADLVPTSVLKQLADDISPLLATLINRALTGGGGSRGLKDDIDYTASEET